MRNRKQTYYREERDRAITTLTNTVTRLRRELNDYNHYADAAEEITEIARAYVPAQLALLKLMKEESEVQNNE